MIDLNGKTALVTGGSRGIGQSIVLDLAKAGAKVAFTSRSASSAEATLEMAKGAGLEVIALCGDVADFEGSQKIAEEATTALGKIDILVNNAGITQDNLFMKMKLEEWDSVLNTNLTGLFNSCKSVIRGMIKQRSGRIINISSVVAHTGNPGQVNYAATKAGMIGFTKSLAKEVASRSITVNAISPGFIETEMTNKLTDEQKAKITKSIPANRMGQASDISGAVLYLASDLSSYVTGTVIHVNGGMY
ncbi:MAG: 3-oxoacyl-[acyl-carrier-protein] reductase [SAR324 cluster bacterium]|nr:3-oxoacyl-[acyl-carrier-protein] reductase [SAR324 cluster bacterium]